MTSAPTTVVAPVALLGLCSSRSNARQREGSAAASSVAAGDDDRQGRVDAAQRAARRSEVDCAPEAVATAVPPLAIDVPRRHTAPWPASCANVERHDRERSSSAGRARVECSRRPPREHMGWAYRISSQPDCLGCGARAAGSGEPADGFHRSHFPRGSLGPVTGLGVHLYAPAVTPESYW